MNAIFCEKQGSASAERSWSKNISQDQNAMHLKDLYNKCYNKKIPSIENLQE